MVILDKGPTGKNMNSEENDKDPGVFTSEKLGVGEHVEKVVLAGQVMRGVIVRTFTMTRDQLEKISIVKKMIKTQEYS